MIVLNLARGKGTMRVPLHLPASGSAVKRAFDLLQETTGKGVTRIDSVTGPVPNLGNYLAHIDISDPDEREKLNTLAAKIDGMDESEQKMFGCVLDARSINGLDDVLTAADSLGNYIYHPQITTERELGEYLVENGLMDVPERLRPYLDYRAIGIEYHAEHSSALTPDGYVVRRSEIPQEQQKEAVFRVLLWSEAMREQKVEPYPLELPAIPERLSEAKRAIGIAEFSEVAIVQAETMLPELRERLPVQCDDVELLNDLGRRITGMRKVEGAYQKFLAVLDVEEPGTSDSANELAKSLDDYTLFSDSAEEYGKASLMANYDIDDEVMNVLEGFFDFEAYGKQQIVEDGARETEFGLLRRDGDPFPSEDMGQQLM